jgi:acetyl esterase/lipase
MVVALSIWPYEDNCSQLRGRSGSFCSDPRGKYAESKQNDDSRRYFEKAAAAGFDVKLDIWTGMPHGFANGVGKLDAIGAFLADRLRGDN